MKIHSIPCALGLMLVVSSSTGGAESPADTFSRNRFSLSFDAGFNVRAEFRNLAPTLTPPPAAGSGLTGDPVDRDYDDGYNRVDFFNNGGGLTWNWGYDNPSQYDGNSTVTMNATGRSGYGATTDATDNPQLGFELKYGRVVGRIGDKKRWGFEGGLSYMNLGIKSDAAMSDVLRVTDHYDLGMPLLPQYQNPPYQGTFNGPGPLSDDLPSRTVETAAMSGWNEFSGHLFALRFGPFLEIPIVVKSAGAGLDPSATEPRLVSQFGLGVSLIYAATEFTYSETASFANGSTVTDSGATSENDVLVGGYAVAQLGYFFTRQWSVLGGVRLETGTGLTANAGNREAGLDFGATLHAFLGVGYDF